MFIKNARFTFLQGQLYERQGKRERRREYEVNQKYRGRGRRMT